MNTEESLGEIEAAAGPAGKWSCFLVEVGRGGDSAGSAARI